MGFTDVAFAELAAAPQVCQTKVEQIVSDLAAERDAAQAQVDALSVQISGLRQQIVDLQTQHAADQQQVASLQTQVASAQAQLVSANAALGKAVSDLAAANALISVLQTQLGSYPDVIVYAEYDNDIIQPLGSNTNVGWVSHTGANIGGVAPSAYSASIVNGKLILSVTGVPGQWCDVLWGNKRAPLPAFVKRLVLDLGVTMDSNTQFVQCLEIDTLVVEDGFKYNMSSQIVSSSGKLQIASGANRGGWLDSGAVPGKLAPGRHTIRWQYSIDRAAKTFQYVAFYLDGKRFAIDPAIGKQPAYTETWSNQLTLQLQQDVNSQGGSFVTTFDSIKYIGL